MIIENLWKNRGFLNFGKYKCLIFDHIFIKSFYFGYNFPFDSCFCWFIDGLKNLFYIFYTKKHLSYITAKDYPKKIVKRPLIIASIMKQTSG